MERVKAVVLLLLVPVVVTKLVLPADAVVLLVKPLDALLLLLPGVLLSEAV